MRWLPLFMLGACASTYAADRATERAELVRRLRAAGGPANLVADGRHYMVKAEALQPEIRNLTTTLADAIEADRDYDEDSSLVMGSEPVIAEPWLERGLRVNDISVVLFRTGKGTLYRIETRSKRAWAIETVCGTPAVDAAWDGLAAAAHAQAAFTNAFGPVSSLAEPGSRGIDTIEWGTTWPPDPPDAPPP